MFTLIRRLFGYHPHWYICDNDGYIRTNGTPCPGCGLTHH